MSQRHSSARPRPAESCRAELSSSFATHQWTAKKSPVAMQRSATTWPLPLVSQSIAASTANSA